jgi:zinc transport system ATP-binding protein
MAHVIELDGVSFHYGNKIILDHINLQVAAGDFVGIVGPNGSGKSTLLKVILGLLHPTHGSVHLFGQRIEKFQAWARIGYVAQNVTSFHQGFPATVSEVVSSGLTASLGLFRRPGRRERVLVDTILEQVGVDDIRNSVVGELSGGQQQKVFIARALVSEPQLLILDEPTVGVDLDAQERFYDLLTVLRRERGITLLMVSHDIGVITGHVTSVACLNRKLHFHGTPSDFWSEGTLARVYGPGSRVLEHSH